MKVITTLPAPLTIAALSLSSLAVAGTLLVEKLHTDYAESRTFEVLISTESSSETTSMEMTIDGEPSDRGGRGGGGGRSSSRTVSYTDKIMTAAEGAPTKVERTYDSVGGSTSVEMREETRDTDVASAFDGLTMILSATDDGVEIEIPDGEAPDDERLKGHRLTLPLDQLLPSEEVEVGAEWDIEGEAFMAALGLDMAQKLMDRPERGGQQEGGGRGGRGGRGGGAGGEATMLAGGTWVITGTLTDATEDVDGVECNVIKITAEVEGEPTPREGRGGRDFAVQGPGALEFTSPQATSSYEGEFEGTLLWSVSEKRPVGLTVEGSFELSTEMTRDTQRGFMEMSRVQETSMKISVDVAAPAAAEPETKKD